MKLYNLLIQITLTFTLITLFDMIIAFSKGIETLYYFDLLTRLSLVFIAFLSLLIFNYLENWPLRFVQLFHYFLSLGLLGLYLYIATFFTLITKSYIYQLLISYSIIYVIILVIYEIYYHKEIKKQNALLTKINRE